MWLGLAASVVEREDATDWLAARPGTDWQQSRCCIYCDDVTHVVRTRWWKIVTVTLSVSLCVYVCTLVIADMFLRRLYRIRGDVDAEADMMMQLFSDALNTARVHWQRRS